MAQNPRSGKGADGTRGRQKRGATRTSPSPARSAGWDPSSDRIDPTELDDVELPPDIAIEAPAKRVPAPAADPKVSRGMDAPRPTRGEREGGRKRPGSAGRSPGRASQGRKAEGRGPGPEADDHPVIYGLHAVAFALKNPDRIITSLFLTENAQNKLADALDGRSVAITRVTPRDLDKRLGADTVHQGALAEVELLNEPSLEDLMMHAVDAGPIVLLDQVTDPHNVGAVLRSAAVFGAAGVAMTRRHSPPLWGTLAKSASGALELVPVALVQNLARALAALGDAGVRRIGLDGEGDVAIDAVDWSGPVALVLGAEGKGLRQSTREACDVIAKVPASGPIASLNVSNAAVVTLYEAARARK